MSNAIRTTNGSRRAAARSIRGLLLGGLVALVGVTAGCESGGANRFMSIGTGGTGGVYYVLGGALASRLNQADPERQYTAEVTGASVENINRIREGQLDLGIVMSISAYEAYYGGMDYDVPVEDLRVIAPLYPNITHVLISRSSDATSLADLRGRRISVGSPGSGTEQVARQLLESVGITYDDIDARYLSFAESSAALQDAAIDAAVISVGYPASAVLEATTTGGARLLPIDDAAAAALIERYPYHRRATIPAGVYRGVTEPVPTISTMNWVVGRSELPADVVDHLLTILVDGKADLIQVHEMAEQIEMADLVDSPIPVHDATTAWLQGRGIEISSEELPTAP